MCDLPSQTKCPHQVELATLAYLAIGQYLTPSSSLYTRVYLVTKAATDKINFENVMLQ